LILFLLCSFSITSGFTLFSKLHKLSPSSLRHVSTSNSVRFGNSLDSFEEINQVAKSSNVLAKFLVCGFLFLGAQSSFAGDNDGTKTDKGFELCISKCVFSETRPPPVGSTNDRLEAVKSRAEIIRDCRKSCAKTKQQLLLGEPKKKLQQTVNED